MEHKKVLIITPFYTPNIGGAESFTEGLVNELKKKHVVFVLTYQPFNGGAPTIEVEKNLTIYRLNWLLPQSTWKGVTIRNFLNVFPRLYFKAFWLVRKEKFDVIHAQGLIAGLIGALIKGSSKLFITMLALYNFQGGVMRKLTRFIFSRCDCVFAEGTAGLFDLEDVATFKTARPFNHWVDQDVFYPPEERHGDKVRVLFVGRPIPEKGKDIVLGAQRILDILYPREYEFTYIENVKFKELPNIYRDHDILCVPSTYSEGFTRVVAEAASCGCSIIVSDRGSLPEMVKGFGKVIPPDSMNLAHAIEQSAFILDAKKIVKIAKERFSPKNAEVFLREYE